jgi:hypothetical protein
MIGGAKEADARMRLGTEPFLDGLCKTRLANTRLAREKHHLTFTGFRPRPASQKQFKFFFPPDESGQCRPMHRLEAALDRAWP